MVALGGTGSIMAPCLGRHSGALLPEIFRFMSQYRMVLYGLILIGVIVLRPGGIMGVKGLFERSEPLFKKHRKRGQKRQRVAAWGGQNVNFNIERLRKTFGGLVAVNDVDLTVQEGTVHIIGPNGAGKTTFSIALPAFIRPIPVQSCLTRNTWKDCPRISFRAKGLRVRLQNIRLFRYMSVLDNVMVGAHHLTKYFFGAWPSQPTLQREEQEIRQFCLYLLEKIGLVDKRHDFAAYLTASSVS